MTDDKKQEIQSDIFYYVKQLVREITRLEEENEELKNKLQESKKDEKN